VTVLRSTEAARRFCEASEPGSFPLRDSVGVSFITEGRNPCTFRDYLNQPNGAYSVYLSSAEATALQAGWLTQTDKL